MNPPFRIFLTKLAETDLADIWDNASDRGEITRCENLGYKTLQRHPDTAGK